MKTQAETEQENDSKSTENQNHFQYSILNQPTTKKGSIGLILIVASIIASGSGLVFGYELANISGALLQLSTEFHLTCAKQEIIVSTIIMGGIIGSLCGGYVIDRWERRMGIIVTSCCYILGAVILSASTSYAMLMGARIIVGIGTTSGVIAACIYLSEVAPPDRRGMLVSLTEFMTVIGVLLAYVFNYTFSRTSNGWRYMFAIVIPLAVLQVIGIFFLPPSPRFMVKKGNDEKASLVLKKIRSYSNVDDELANIKSSLSNENNYNFLDLFRSKNLRMRFCIGFGLAIFLQATGQPNVLFYASTILRSVGFASDSTATLASVSIGLVKVLGTILAVLLIDKVGRKTFLCIGSTIIVVSLIILALLIHKIPMQFTDICHYPNHTNRWQDNITSSMLGQHSVAVTALPSRTDFLSSVTKQDNMTIMQNVSSSPFTGSPEVDGHRNEPIPPVLKWLCLCSLLVYVAAYSISFGPVIWVLLSEIFPVGIKGRAVALIACLNWALSLLIALTFLSVTELIGLMWVLLIYAIVSFIGLPFIIFIVPETKGQTLEEISEQLNQGYNRTPICCTTKRIKRLIPGIFRKQRDGEHSIWATDIQYHTDGLENYVGDSTL
ncbi:solute carrier family 2, facilitated glucose transporter member 12 isoform X1 [Hemiscyllium ocellatum]|uniref:solute carrier family 2, facilitated glucose transporter member 12 isoform X1 n=1 Tax=Hemiscyllium ocellatum TaxID=170820 RepID=UPI0029670791|nr:solute carrier family 2, facilitated glucose transporter member 12 isoform X1 [Hemiscyllium ocellatum]